MGPKDRDADGGFAGYQGDIELDLESQPSRGGEARGSTRPPGGRRDVVARREPMSDPRVAALPPERPASVDGGLWPKLIVLVVLGGLGFGGYYFYCTWKAGDKLHDFHWAVQDLRQDLMKKLRKIDEKDISQVVDAHALRKGVVVERLAVSIESMSTGKSRLPDHVAAAMNMVGGMSRHRVPQCVVGFAADVAAQHGIVTRRAHVARYTYFDEMKKPCGPPPRIHKDIDWNGKGFR